ncbi:NAD(P)-binding protein [Hypoxylon sp. FL1284]|nr:NAD(P)-binding protein [Hypoxylon sp. FL1284]
MSQNVLITGAAGYIGGSVLAGLLSHPSTLLKALNITAVVRSSEQVQTLKQKLGVNVIQADVGDAAAMTEAILGNEIDIVIHTTSSRHPHIMPPLINALGRRREISGKETYLIHASVATAFTTMGGWPVVEEVRDTEPLLAKEKEIQPGHPVRDTNILVTEEAKAHGVNSFIIAVPTVYGRGTGEGRKVSVNIPAYTRVAIEHKAVLKFEVNGYPPAVHIADLTDFYTLLMEKILQKENVPKNEDGYYFVVAHQGDWWAVAERMAKALYARGLVEQLEVKTWPSYESAADELGWPRAHIRAMGSSGGKLISAHANGLGWQPKWDKERFLNSIDDEVQSVLELGTVKSTLFAE